LVASIGFRRALGPPESETRFVNARSALFDLYGDHLLSRGRQAPIAALVRLMAPLGISAPAVRTAVSRMTRQGWLQPVRLPAGAGYRLTPRAVQRLEQAADRIYRRDPPSWDQRWHVVVVADPVADRAARDRLRSGLRYLGYGRLDGSAWISPRASVELSALLVAEQVGAECFHASYDGDSAALAARSWDLAILADAYRQWLDMARQIVPAAPGPGPGAAQRPAEPSDEAIFAARTELVHQWRKFLFVDPGLPAELLPAGWPGTEAAELFRTEAARLMPAAARFVDCCLAAASRAGERRPVRADSAMRDSAITDKESP
jgi:phenylacetic acid degradation operon negative regulatory protein